MDLQLFAIDLQLFAEERTEEATQRRLQKAREEGRAPRSADLMAGITLVAATMALKTLGPSIYEVSAGGMEAYLSGLTRSDLTNETAGILLLDSALLFLRAVLPLTLVILAIGVGAGLLQTKLLFSWEPLTPDFERISPLTGFKRIFSIQTAVEQVKGMIKLAVIGAVIYFDVAAVLPKVPNLMGQNAGLGAAFVASHALAGLQKIGFALLALGVLDYGYQWWEFRRSLRMTKTEVKREHKEQEGSPEVRQRQRAKAREMAMRRKAIKDVPQADVVITNPTHFAIALRYQAGEDAVPKVIAKGTDLLAQRIKVLAKQNQIPMVENRPLARTLYQTVPIGKPVPPELYQAVAEVLAFVYNLRRDQRRAGKSVVSR